MHQQIFLKISKLLSFRIFYAKLLAMVDKNAVYWITGASSGIGEALAREVYLRGGRVILSARNEEKLTAICRDWQDAERWMILPLDMINHELMEAAAQRAWDRWEQLDVLINNAGISQRSTAIDTNYDVMKTIMDVNYMGSAWLTRCVLPYMIKQKKGAIAAVSSVAGKFATPLRSSYSASKMALQGYYDGLRAEIHNQGISVSLIIPGFVNTGISLNALEGNGKKHGVMDSNQAAGIPPEKAALIALKGIAGGKREIYMGIKPKIHLALFLSRMIPGILARIVRSADVT